MVRRILYRMTDSRFHQPVVRTTAFLSRLELEELSDIVTTLQHQKRKWNLQPLFRHKVAPLLSQLGWETMNMSGILCCKPCGLVPSQKMLLCLCYWIPVQRAMSIKFSPPMTLLARRAISVVAEAAAGIFLATVTSTKCSKPYTSCKHHSHRSP